MSDSAKPLFSIIIPARNEEKLLPQTITNVIQALDPAGIPFEIIIVDDYSRDGTMEVAAGLTRQDTRIRAVRNDGNPGYGIAVRSGLAQAQGGYITILMADASDSPADLVRYYETMRTGYECVFGTRFSRQSELVNYPILKLCINRLANLFIQVLFWIPYNDVTNAFKCYSRSAIETMAPLISKHFNLTVEMPLKAIIRGCRWTVIPVDWHGRLRGFSKWNFKEMGSRYLFITLYLWLEKLLSRGDYYCKPKSHHAIF
jgi:dolichol-phosphate mannosyltransferase